MQRWLISAMILAAAIPAANAQRGGGGAGGGGGARGGGGGAAGRSGMGSGGGRGFTAGRAGRVGGNWRGNNWLGRRGGYGSGFAGYGGFGYPGWGYADSYADAYPAAFGDYGAPGESQPSPVVLLMQVAPPEPEPPPPPPEPAHPVMHEYAWPGVANNAPAHFSIAAKTGPVREALAVWVQDGRVKYTAAGGSTGSLALAAVDCGTTDRLNTANHLKLSLPGCASPK